MTRVAVLQTASRSACAPLTCLSAVLVLLCCCAVFSMEWRKRKQFLLDKAKLRPALEKEAAEKAAASK